MEGHHIYLQHVIETHVDKISSAWGQTILADFEHYARKFYLVKPKAANVATLGVSLREANHTLRILFLVICYHVLIFNALSLLIEKRRYFFDNCCMNG